MAERHARCPRGGPGTAPPLPPLPSLLHPALRNRTFYIIKYAIPVGYNNIFEITIPVNN